MCTPTEISPFELSEGFGDREETAGFRHRRQNSQQTVRSNVHVENTPSSVRPALNGGKESNDPCADVSPKMPTVVFFLFITLRGV